jgi:hypothetical protein
MCPNRFGRIDIDDDIAVSRNRERHSKTADAHFVLLRDSLGPPRGRAANADGTPLDQATATQNPLKVSTKSPVGQRSDRMLVSTRVLFKSGRLYSPIHTGLRLFLPPLSNKGNVFLTFEWACMRLQYDTRLRVQGFGCACQSVRRSRN